MFNEKNDLLEATDTQAIAPTADSTYLSGKETRKILTPFAFEIDKSLFGLALAAPRKRAIALLIDFIFISILAETPGEFLALLVAITFYKIANNKHQQKIRLGNMLLKGLSIMIILLSLLSLVSPLTNEWFTDNGDKNSPFLASKTDDVINTIAVSAITLGFTTELSQSQCDNSQCWAKLISPKLIDFVDVGLSPEKMTNILITSFKKISLPNNEQEALIQALAHEYSQLLKVNNTIKKDKKESNYNKEAVPAADTETKLSTDENSSEKTMVYKGVEWVKGVINDLGLSFGWAALYFSVLTSAWNGQTLGKRFMKIRVIQLDGTALSVWDSFGRYGGYGAGLATGLMGFMQIYWDANRQCIHDKIASTVVIDLRKIK